MTKAERVDVLTLVDRQNPVGQPLLTSLVATGDPGMARAYGQVALALRLEVPAGDDDLRDVLEADVAQVHRQWLHR